MSDRKIVEETGNGYQMEVWSTVAYRGPDGRLVDRDTYVDAREGSLGYGGGEYGADGYGE